MYSLEVHQVECHDAMPAGAPFSIHSQNSPDHPQNSSKKPQLASISQHFPDPINITLKCTIYLPFYKIFSDPPYKALECTS